MSGGNRLYRLALGGCLIGAILWLLVTPALAPPEKAEDRAYTQHGTSQTKQTPTPQQEVPVGVIPAAEPISSSGTNSSGAQNPAGDAEAEKQRPQADLEAQQDMAFWAMLMVAVSAVSVVVAGVAVYLVFLTLREAGKTTKAARNAVEETQNATSEAKRANEIAQQAVANSERMGQLQVRAYLIIASAYVRLLNNGNIEISGICKNSGQTPAGNVIVHFRCRISFDLQNDEYAIPNSLKFFPDMGGDSEHPFTARIDHEIPLAIRNRFKHEHNTAFIVSFIVEYQNIFEQNMRGESRFWTTYGEGVGFGSARKELGPYPHTWQQHQNQT